MIYQSAKLLGGIGRSGSVTQLDDPSYWGREITDERYLVVSIR